MQIRIVLIRVRLVHDPAAIRVQVRISAEEYRRAHLEPSSRRLKISIHVSYEVQNIINLTSPEPVTDHTACAVRGFMS
jgi:hypothetical protein